MADFGIQTFRADGSVAMDGSNKAGIFIEILQLTGTDSKVYPEIPVGCLYHFVVAGGGRHTVRVGSDGAGNAKVSWSINPYDVSDPYTYVAVFARKVRSSSDYGVLLLSDSDDILVDYNHPVPQYITTLRNPVRASAGQYGIGASSGGILTKASYIVPSTRTNTNRIALMYLPDSTTNNIWYACNGFVPTNQESQGVGTVRVEVYIFDPSFTQNYQMPTLHLFSIDGPISGGGTFGLQCFSSAGSLVYDSSAENVSVKDVASIVTNGNNGAAVSFPMSLPTITGVVSPFYDAIWYKSYREGSIKERYMGLVQRKGNTIYYQIKLVDGVVGARNDSDAMGYEQHGDEYGGGLMAVDVSQFSPQLIQASGV